MSEKNNKNWKCKCGCDVMFADTEDFDIPLCVNCYEVLVALAELIQIENK